jgi:hypothetical protein
MRPGSGHNIDYVSRGLRLNGKSVRALKAWYIMRSSGWKAA